MNALIAYLDSHPCACYLGVAAGLLVTGLLETLPIGVI